jgi:Bacterial regulatory protein, Fis family
MERIILLSVETVIRPETLEQLRLPPADASATVSVGARITEVTGGTEADQIRQALQCTAGNVARAARLLGIGRGALRHRMARLGLMSASYEHTNVGASPPPTAMPTEETVRRYAGAGSGHLPRSSAAPASGWERKPAALLVVEITWPDVEGQNAAAYERWTIASRWEQAIQEKVLGFGGVLLPHVGSLLVVAFGVPQALEHVSQRAVEAALAVGRLMTDPAMGGAPPELRLAVHRGQLLVAVEANDPPQGSCQWGRA